MLKKFKKYIQLCFKKKKKKSGGGGTAPLVNEQLHPCYKTILKYRVSTL